jgi:hypothetical protein
VSGKVLEHLGVVGRAQASDGVPSWHCTEALRATAWVVTRDNVVCEGKKRKQEISKATKGGRYNKSELTEHARVGVECWIDKAHCALSHVQASLVDQRQDGCKDGR